jgi:hypothetical protein
VLVVGRVVLELILGRVLMLLLLAERGGGIFPVLVQHLYDNLLGRFLIRLVPLTYMLFVMMLGE